MLLLFWICSELKSDDMQWQVINVNPHNYNILFSCPFQDINECNQSPCEQTCRNTIGSFRCSCAAGFQLNADQRSCVDIDECIDAALSDSELCPGSFECLNSIGSYLCVCPPGYQNRSGLCQINIPPKIWGLENFFIADVGEPSVYHFYVMDDEETYTVGVVGGIPAGANITYYKENYTFTWILHQIQNVSLTFYISDSLNVTTQLSVQVRICACQNRGNCTLNGLNYITDAHSVIMNCECSKAYNGPFCEEDKNGCVEDFCYTGVECYDMPAPQLGIICGPCPVGYTGDGRVCTAFSATQNAVDITLARYMIDSFTSDTRSKFIITVQNILKTYCTNGMCSSQVTNTEYMVIIRNIMNTAAGLVITLQVQTPNFVLSTADITQALTQYNSSLVADGFVVVSIAQYSEPISQWSGGALAGIILAVVATSVIMVAIVVSVTLLFKCCCLKMHHKSKSGTREEMTMDVLEHTLAIDNVYDATTHDQLGEVRSLEDKSEEDKSEDQRNK
ncbi:hypothetical protein EMCRGX_G029980 [Ephydatia muelleri]